MPSGKEAIQNKGTNMGFLLLNARSLALCRQLITRHPLPQVVHTYCLRHSVSLELYVTGDILSPSSDFSEVQTRGTTATQTYFLLWLIPQLIPNALAWDWSANSSTAGTCEAANKSEKVLIWAAGWEGGRPPSWSATNPAAAPVVPLGPGMSCPTVYRSPNLNSHLLSLGPNHRFVPWYSKKKTWSMPSLQRVPRLNMAAGTLACYGQSATVLLLLRGVWGRCKKNSG